MLHLFKFNNKKALSSSRLNGNLRFYAKSQKTIQNKETSNSAPKIEKSEKKPVVQKGPKKYVDEVPTVHNSKSNHFSIFLKIDKLIYLALFHPNMTAMFAAKEARGLTFEEIGKVRKKKYISITFFPFFLKQIISQNFFTNFSFIPS